MTRSSLIWSGPTALFLVAAAPGSSSGSEPSRLGMIAARDKLIVGVTDETPPFGFVDANGQLAGFDIDVARLIAKALLKSEAKVEFVRQPFSERWQNVRNGKVDVGIQLTTVYPDRLLQVAFTSPYIDTAHVMLARKALNATSLSDLDRPDIRAGQLNYPQQEEHRVKFFPKAQRIVFEQFDKELAALKSGEIDVLEIDSPVAKFLSREDASLAVVPGELDDPGYNAIFVRQNDFQLWLAMDQVVASMRGGPLASEFAKLHVKWFGEAPSRHVP